MTDATFTFDWPNQRVGLFDSGGLRVGDMEVSGKTSKLLYHCTLKTGPRISITQGVYWLLKADDDGVELCHIKAYQTLISRRPVAKVNDCIRLSRSQSGRIDGLLESIGLWQARIRDEIYQLLGLNRPEPALGGCAPGSH